MKNTLLISAFLAIQAVPVAGQTPGVETGESAHGATVATPAQFGAPVAPVPYPFPGPAAGTGVPPIGPVGPLGPPQNSGWLRNANTDLYSTLPPGWPSVGVSRRDYKHPDPNAHPRDSGLEVRVPPTARVFVDDEEIQCKEGKYRYAPDTPLIPGNAYALRVRVETQNEFGMLVVRAVTVYLRLGRITVLTFE